MITDDDEDARDCEMFKPDVKDAVTGERSRWGGGPDGAVFIGQFFRYDLWWYGRPLAVECGGVLAASSAIAESEATRRAVDRGLHELTTTEMLINLQRGCAQAPMVLIPQAGTADTALHNAVVELTTHFKEVGAEVGRAIGELTANFKEMADGIMEHNNASDGWKRVEKSVPVAEVQHQRQEQQPQVRLAPEEVNAVLNFKRVATRVNPGSWTQLYNAAMKLLAVINNHAEPYDKEVRG